MFYGTAKEIWENVKETYSNNENTSELFKIKGDDYEEMNRLKTILAKEFEIKDLEKLKYFLGMDVAHSNKGISISQRKYTLDLLKETGMFSCKPADTLMDSTCKLGVKEGSTPVDKGRYQRLVGRLIYLLHTRPAIEFFVSQFVNNPTEEYPDAVYRILRSKLETASDAEQVAFTA
ncbi:hypothetical protein RJ640_002215 [Escallonia rubra]|uniref:Reverse transcriptase Ty1/copia-type domain-containing protein n=1 Tax=Escallonia rubra TaxID=112253 RepID=A0AA88UCD9_9ASTE|nr:hypothetical protein RJ640_002215 [Escallonia rubra]